METQLSFPKLSRPLKRGEKIFDGVMPMRYSKMHKGKYCFRLIGGTVIHLDVPAVNKLLSQRENQPK